MAEADIQGGDMTKLSEAVDHIRALIAHLRDLDSACPEAANMTLILRALEERTEALNLLRDWDRLHDAFPSRVASTIAKALEDTQ